MWNIIGNIFFNFIFLSLFYFIFPILIFKAFEFFKGLSFLKNLPYWAKFGRNVVFVYWSYLILLAFTSGHTISGYFGLIILNPYLIIFPDSLMSNLSLLIIITVIGGTLFYFILGVIIGKIVEFLSKIYFFKYIFNLWFIPFAFFLIVSPFMPLVGMVIMPVFYPLLSFFEFTHLGNLYFSEGMYATLPSDILTYLFLMIYCFLISYLLYKIIQKFKEEEENTSNI